MKLHIGKGVDDVRFGMREKDVVKALGKPDKVYDQDDGKHLQYFALQLDLAFDAEEDDRLHWISSTSPTLEVLGMQLLGKSQDEVLGFLSTQLDDDVDIDDYGSFESHTFEDSWLELQFEYGVLTTINAGHMFDENDDPIWPED